MSDEQMGFDIEFDAKTEAWLAWSEPELMQSKVRDFITETIGETFDGEWWQAPRLVGILEKARDFFGDLEGFRDPENRAKADQLVRLVGECYVRRGMEWTNRPEWGEGMYTDFGPAVRGANNDVRSVVMLTGDIFDRGYGPRGLVGNMKDVRAISRT
jgi:hypothetical protein